MEKSSVKYKMIDEDAVPGRVKKRHGEWLELIKTIPSGKALALTEDELDVKPVTVKAIVNKLVRTGELPKNYKTVQRTNNKKITLYIINSAK